METSVHAKSGDNTVVTPFVWHGFLDGVRLKGNFKAAGVQDIEYGDTALNMMCISGGVSICIASRADPLIFFFAGQNPHSGRQRSNGRS